MIERKLTPKQRVLKMYPTAVCEENGDVHQIAVLLPYGKAAVLEYSRNGPRGAWLRTANLIDRMKP